MLCLNEAAIHQAVSRAEILDKVEETLKFQETGEFLMPVRTHLDYQGNTLLLMPCFTNKFYGTKLVSLHPDNPAKNKPMIHAVVVINDGETGEPLALIDGRVLTALRTGAAGGVGVRWLSPKEPHGLGIIGAGVQGFQQALFAAEAATIDYIRVFDADKTKIIEFIDKINKLLPDVPAGEVQSVEELLEKSRTVITATTSKSPVLPHDENLLRGRHFIGIGSYKPDMREFPDELFRLIDTMYVDTMHALKESGDAIDPVRNGHLDRSQIRTLGSLISGKGSANAPDGKTTLFKSVGMALFDVMVGHLIYTRAKEKGLGLEMDM